MNLFDARHGALIPTLASEGSAFPVIDKTTYAMNVGPNETAIALCSNVGVAGTLAMIVKYNASSVESLDTFTCPRVNGTSATFMRAMKATLGILNTTQRLNQCGRVFAVNLHQRVVLPTTASSMTRSQWDDLANNLRALPDAKAYSGPELGAKTHHWSCFPTNNTNYLDYLPWETALTVNEFTARVADPNGATLQSRPMSTIAVVIDTPTTQQNYNFIFHGMWYARYAISSIMARAMRPVPTAPPSIVNRLRDIAEHVKDEAVHGIGEVAKEAWGVVKPALTGLAFSAATGALGGPLALEYPTASVAMRAIEVD